VLQTQEKSFKGLEWNPMEFAIITRGGPEMVGAQASGPR
jgi:hypothetical protein